MIIKTGDWDKLHAKLQQLATTTVPNAKEKLREDGKSVVETIQGHIDRQDLSWSPLADTTLKQKQTTDIYVDTGALRDNICVNTVKNTSKEVAYHIGVSPNKIHPESGLKYTDLLMYMEYGTLTQPSRPLIQPTSKEIQTRLKQEWIEFIKSEIGG